MGYTIIEPPAIDMTDKVLAAISHYLNKFPEDPPQVRVIYMSGDTHFTLVGVSGQMAFPIEG